MSDQGKEQTNFQDIPLEYLGDYMQTHMVIKKIREKLEDSNVKGEEEIFSREITDPQTKKQVRHSFLINFSNSAERIYAKNVADGLEKMKDDPNRLKDLKDHLERLLQAK